MAMSKAENNTYRVETDVFFCELFIPIEDKYPDKALICFSNGKFERQKSWQVFLNLMG